MGVGLGAGIVKVGTIMEYCSKKLKGKVKIKMDYDVKIARLYYQFV